VFEFALPTPAIASYGFATVAFAAFAVRVALGWRGGAKATILLVAVCASALWASLNLAFATVDGTALWVTQSLADGLRMSAWIAFALLLLRGAQALPLTVAGGTAVCVALFLLREPAPLGMALQAAPSRAPFAILLGLAIGGLVLSEQVLRRAGEAARWAVKPLCLALAASFVFDLYVHADALLFGRLDADLWAVRGFAQVLVIPFIAVATARNKDWTIDIAFSRGVVLHSTALLACGVYLLAVAAAGYYVRYFGGNWVRTFQAGFIFAALLVLGWLFSSGALRAKLRVFINKNFFSYRYDYREEWLRFTNYLSAREPGVSMPQRSIRALAHLVESPAGSLWLRSADGAFGETARWNWPELGQPVDAAHSLPRFLEKTGWVIDLTEYRRGAEPYREVEVPAWLTSVDAAWLVVPIVSQEELIGFVVLASPRTPVDVNWEVRDLLKAAARQAGSVLAQIQASEALLEARKFEAFNKMAAFVVHDLKNLVAQLGLLLKNAERHRQNPRFQADMLSTVEHVAERMNKLLLQLANGGLASERARPVDLGKLAARVVGAKRTERADMAIEDTGQVVTLAHENRFERVVGHLVQNAIDATREGGSVRVGVFAEDHCAVLEVSDSGCGMSEAFVRDQLFRPFQTTKPTGMGIGAFETAQYVKEIGGRIEAHSRPGAGTRIKVMLPLHREHVAGGEPAREAA